MKPTQHTTSIHNLQLALAAVLLSLMTARGAQSSLGTQSRTNLSRFGPSGVWKTTATAAGTRLTRQAELTGEKEVVEVGPNHRSWKTNPDDSAGAPTNRLSRARGSTKPSVVEIASGMN